MNPRVRMRVGQPTELSWSLLERLLCQVSQHEEPCIGARRERTILLGTITTAGARLPLHGAVLQLDHQRLFNMRPQGHTCRFRDERSWGDGTLQTLILSIGDQSATGRPGG